MKVLFRFDAAPLLVERCLRLAADGLDVVLCSEHDEQDYLGHLADADALWHVLRPVTAEAIDSAHRLRLIQKIGVGLNTIDLEAARSRGIAVCNMPGTNSRAVAEQTLALTLRPAEDALIRCTNASRARMVVAAGLAGPIG